MIASHVYRGSLATRTVRLSATPGFTLQACTITWHTARTRLILSQKRSKMVKGIIVEDWRPVRTVTSTEDVVLWGRSLQKLFDPAFVLADHLCGRSQHQIAIAG